MNLLAERLPTSVEIDGRVYKLDTDYRTAVKFEALMLDEAVDEGLKNRLALNLFYPTIPADTKAAVEKILWFYAGNDTRLRAANTGNQGRGHRIYSFDCDCGMIIAAFWHDYRIDLTSTALHWWLFLELFAALGEDNQICKIMGYRAADLSKMKGEQKSFYRRMKKLYEIPLPKSEQDKLDAISDALVNGGDLSKVLAK